MVKVRAALPSLLAALVAMSAPAQVRVKLHAPDKPDALTQQVMRLGQDSSRDDATTALLHAGRAAVPMLAKAAAADDVTSMPALRVLAELGPRARPARAALLRLGAQSTALGRAALEALAAIGERDSVAFCDWKAGEIVELDTAGTLLRKVAAKGAWWFQIVANDHLLVCAYGDNVVREIDWNGKEIDSWPTTSPLCAQRMIDGSMWVSNATNKRMRHLACGQHPAAADPVPAEFDAKVRAFRVLPNDHLLLLLDGSIREVTATGALVRELPTGKMPMGFAVGEGGDFALIYQTALFHVDAAGKEVEVHLDDGVQGFSLTVAALHDGSHLLGEGNRLSWRRADGTMLWQYPATMVSCIVARIDVPDAK